MSVRKSAYKKAQKLFDQILNQTEDEEVLEALYDLLDEYLHVTYL